MAQELPEPRALGPWHTHVHKTYIHTHTSLFILKPSITLRLGGPHMQLDKFSIRHARQGMDNMDAQSTVHMLQFGIALIGFARAPPVFCACTLSPVGNILYLKNAPTQHSTTLF
jgi:hypothetical protein